MDHTKETNLEMTKDQNSSTIPKTLSLSPKDVDKLMRNYNKLKSKYNQKVKENEFLKQNLDNAFNVMKTFEESNKSIQSMYSQVKDWIASLKTTSTNQDFSTTDVSNFHKTSNKNPEMTMLTNNPYQNNLLLIKKLEEFELYYNEMSKSFNNLVVKYKMVKEEKNKMEESSLKLLTRYSQLEKQYDETIKELYLRYDEIKRFKEIDKCLVDYTLNSFMLRVDPKELGGRSLNNALDPPGIKCEPLPTFAKFLANKK